MYYRVKLRYQIDSYICRLCKEQLGTVAHILAGCPALAQNHYTDRHKAGLKCLYFTLLKHYGLINRIPPWHSPIVPKPEIKNDEVRILWDVPTHTAECKIQTTSQQSNGPDVTVFDKRAQEILVVEFNCPWVTNRVKKDEEKTEKYAQLREKLKALHQGYTVNQINVIVDVLGAESKTLGKQLAAVIGAREAKRAIKAMPKAILAHSVRIKNFLKMHSN